MDADLRHNLDASQVNVYMFLFRWLQMKKQDFIPPKILSMCGCRFFSSLAHTRNTTLYICIVHIRQETILYICIMLVICFSGLDLVLCFNVCFFFFFKLLLLLMFPVA